MYNHIWYLWETTVLKNLRLCALQDSEVSELSELSDEDVKYRKVENRLGTASPAPSMEDPDNVVRIKLQNLLSFQLSCDKFKIGKNMVRYLKKHELLKIQANVTVQWLKQKLKFLQKGKKEDRQDKKNSYKGIKKEWQKNNLLIQLHGYVEYWKNSWTTSPWSFIAVYQILMVVKCLICIISASPFKAFLCVQYHFAFTNDRNSRETKEKIRKTKDTEKKRKSETPSERQ